MEFFEPLGYGRFDPAAFGMWVNVDKVLEHPRYGELGPRMWTTFHFELNDEHRDYVRSSEPREDAVFGATCFTVATHERRHFHDLLATPYGSMLARQYLRAAFFNGVLTEEILFRRKNVGVPLDEWCQNPGFFQASFGIAPPSDNIREISAIFRTMQQKLAAFEHGQLNPEHSPEFPTGTSILEGIAVMMQLRQIGEEFGRPYGEAFGRSVLESAGGSRYFGALSLVSRVLGRRLPIAVEALLLQASLYGNFQDPDTSRPRYPIDVLASLLTWFRDERVFESPLLPPGDALLHYVASVLNEYFEERHGGPLADMARQATVANRAVADALRQDLARYAELSGNSNSLCECVLQIFDNFNTAQAAFSQKVVQNLPWYVSYDYVRERFTCPAPLMFIESRKGIPVDSRLAELYYVQVEDRLYLSPDVQARLRADPQFPIAALDHAEPVEALSEDMLRNWRTIARATSVEDETAARVAPNTLVLRNAYVLSPRATSFSGSPGEELDLSLWQRFYDQTCPMRLFLEGPDLGMPAASLRDTLAAFHACHTAVYSASGLLEAEELDPHEVGDLSSGILSMLGAHKKS
jgi:hypothetical protein